MRVAKLSIFALALGVMPLAAAAQSTMTVNQVVDKTVAQERAEIDSFRKYSPLVETYIQNVRPDQKLGAVPDGDQYFLGRAELAKGITVEPLVGGRGKSIKKQMFAGLDSFLAGEFEFLPRGFLQMIYVDRNGFDRQHYKFEYAGREFLGEVRCYVFDVDPLPSGGKGRFVGRIWVEDQDYHIVRFNGGYSGSSKLNYYFNFDSWRTRTANNQWLPAFIYTEEGDAENGRKKDSAYKAFKAQTRLWGYALDRSTKEQELGTVLVEAPTPVEDQSETANDYSPIQAERFWNRQAEDNITGKMERLGLMAPYGEVDKVLETVVNNLEVGNDIDVQPEVRCRVLMTSSLESFTVGHTIVLSRGLIDVIPDEPTLAAVIAHELGHILLGQRVDTEFAFFNHLRFDDKDTFRHFDFAHSPAEEQAANQKGAELLKKSPYKDNLGSAQMFFEALQSRSKDIPALISPHLGDGVSTDWTIGSAAPSTQDASQKPATSALAALPLGGRIKVDPWGDRLQMLKTKPAAGVAEYEKMPFEIAPVVLYLRRPTAESAAQTTGTVAAKSNVDAIAPDVAAK